MTSQKNSPNRESLLSFPCRFPIKAMGRADSAFEGIATHIVRSHAELWPEEPVVSTPSKQGNYVSLTFVIVAKSQDQLDTIYQELSDSPDVLMAL